MREMRDTLRATFGRVLGLQNRRRALRRGALDWIPDFESKILANKRGISIYLPPSYMERPESRYPVLYMQDGQNLFEPERAFAGQHWRLDSAAEVAIDQRSAEPMIIVGIDHAGTGRIDEYTPTRDTMRRAGGRTNDYGRMLIEELKPAVDSRYRTRPQGENTALGGSSLGGLVSLYLGLTRPDVFSRIAAMSPSIWWDGKAILGVLDRFNAPRRPRIWLDVGGREGRDALSDVRLLRDRLMAKGWGGGDFAYHEDRRGEHSETAWARRVGGVLEFLFPPPAP
jgi:predicted alpha/beta superfamily hydrolase